MAHLREICDFLDDFLRIHEVPDEPRAVNGLQVEAGSEIRVLALAVDAGESTIERACAEGAQLLVVHHGLFWGGLRPLAGALGRKIRRAFGAGLSVYAAHIPLDVHPDCGNNVELLRALGLSPDGVFAKYQGIDLGLTASCDWTAAQLRERVEAAVGPVRALGRGPERVRRLGVITGGGASYVGAAARAGLDALVTGEGPHYTALEAEEQRLHLILAGHYRTETFGVRALGNRLASRFGLRTVFLPHDTGL